MSNITLSDIVSMPAFEEAGALFHKATGMTISFPDEAGGVIFYPAEERCAFCHLVQSTPEGRERCRVSDERAAERALRNGRPMAYTCHAGLTDVVVPVVVGDKRIGCFFSGQSVLTPPTPMGYQEIRARIADLNLDPEAIWEAYMQIPLVDSDRLELAMGL
ncbi:MAG: PocR ligand-binding domain-containing protein, partial [Armatimonadota bacterium]